MESIEICYSFGSCLFYSTQGWPALGQQSIDLVVMSYISGTVSVFGGTLGAFGMYAAYKVRNMISLSLPLNSCFSSDFELERREVTLVAKAERG